MENSQSNTKRVAKNTLFLYFRMILILFVTLYTSRVILDQLGVEDFGIYNVVGGVVAMFGFLNSCMVSSTQRFLTYELGNGNIEKLKKIFAASLNIHMFIGVAIVILAETIGLWFVNQQLVIPQNRIFAANCVYQLSIAAFFVNIMQVPYNAAIIAHERMSIYAYISIFEAILKLIIVYLISLAGFDKLIFYAVLTFCVTIIVRGVYCHYCYNKFVECRFLFFWEKKIYSEMTEFAGWNLFGSVAWILRDQGINILLNLFFGPIVNAARGVANRVSGAIMGFIGNFQTALNPQITKLYAQNELAQMEQMAYRGIKFSYMVLFCISLPLCLNVDYLLDIWLTEIPNQTNIFVILIIVDALVGNLFGIPFMTALSATGNIRNYQIVVGCIIIMVVPISFILLKLGFDATSVFYAVIFINFVSGVVRFIFCNKQIGFKIQKYISNVLFPVITITVISLPISIFSHINFFSSGSLFDFVFSCMFSFLVCIIIVFFIGMNNNERAFITNLILKKIRR